MIIIGIYIKDLRIIGNRNIKDISIVDNACYSFAHQIDNGVPIIPFYRNKEDVELKELVEYVKKYQECDICELNRRIFKLGRYAEHSDVTDLLKEII